MSYERGSATDFCQLNTASAPSATYNPTGAFQLIQESAPGGASVCKVSVEEQSCVSPARRFALGLETNGSTIHMSPIRPQPKIRVITPAESPYVVDPDDEIILVDATTGDVTINLADQTNPDFVCPWHQVFYIKRWDASANTVTVANSGPGSSSLNNGGGPINLAGRDGLTLVSMHSGDITLPSPGTQKWVTV